MHNKQENKLHYKMYKSGKFWVISGLFAFVAINGVTFSETNVKADTTVITTTAPSTTNASANTSANSNTTTSSSNNDTNVTDRTNNDVAATTTVSDNSNQTNATQSSQSNTNQTSSNSSNDNKTSSNADSNNTSSNSNNTSPASSSNDSNNSSAPSSNTSSATSNNSNKASSNSTSSSTSSNTTSSNKTSATNTSSNTVDKYPWYLPTVNNQAPSTNYTTTNTINSNNNSLNSNQATDSANSLASAVAAAQSSQSSSSNSSNSANSSNSNIINTNAQQATLPTIKVDNSFGGVTLPANPTTVDGNIKQNNGNYQYYNSDNQIKKNILISTNNQLMYFDNNGNYTSLSAQLPQTNVVKINNEFAQNNAIYSLDASNITTANGFLTADSWYRPKQILKNGTDWTPAGANDMRPLLMVWWPDKQTQVNYLNYMNKNNLTSSTYTNDSDLNTLEQGAQDVQRNIERTISANNGNTTWLKTLMTNFVNSQPQWNITSEDSNLSDGFQGGTLSFNNYYLTPYANSNYRLTNRAPALQTGVAKYNYDSWNGYEYLLGNDVDNSNPVVQAENLNWLYYLMNIGNITNVGSNGNFDSIRIDAVDNMNADILQQTRDYFKDAYGTNLNDKTANAHLSILEDWSKNDAYYLKDNGQGQLSIDDLLHFNFTNTLNQAPNARSAIKNLINGSLVNRSNDTTSNKAIPNYMFVRAHDSGVQDIIFSIIKDHINPNAVSTSMTPTDLAKAFKYYNADMKKTNKKYTYYNVPASYATLLTNKDIVPRVYYGDMYTDDGQYMSKKTLYYEAINAMLLARQKYVAGGQAMKSVNKDVITSVRFGKNANKITQKGNKLTRSSGIGVVMSNNPKLKETKVVMNMGAAHRNQAYRPLILTTKHGTQEFNNDKSAKKHVVHTNSKGQLILSSKQVKGYANPQVSGYLSMWVPVGAKSTQRVTTAPSTKSHKDGKILHSNAALDSNVIFESFSNFQSQPTNNKQYMNVILQNKAKQLKKWGFTSIQLPPQYRSVDGNSFVDATIHNGYAFNDRYDLGYNTPTKYGTITQLTDTIKALHSQGLQAMADLVPNQLYNLNTPEVVSVNRVDMNGNYNGNTNIYNDLYYANTTGGGQYQQQYGGEFLAKLQQLYPDLFTAKQISTGQTIDPSTKIKQWSAKYLNGTNIQGRGAEYVLRNSGNTDYFMLNSSGFNLPNQLLGNQVQTGFVNNNGNVNYYSYSGQMVKNSVVNINGAIYAFDASGNLITGNYTTPDGIKHVSLPNGQGLTNAFYLDNGKLEYFTKNGNIYTNGFMANPYNASEYYYFGKDGVALVGPQTVNGQQVFFSQDGIQVKGQIVNSYGTQKYYDPNNGYLVTDQIINIGGQAYKADRFGNLTKTSNSSIGPQDIAQAKNTFDKAKVKLNKAKLKLHKASRIKTNQENYQIALNSYYSSERNYYQVKGIYNQNYYYDFDNATTLKLKQKMTAYANKNLTKKNGTLKKNAKIKVKKIYVGKNQTKIETTAGKFISGLKTLFKSL